MTFQKEPFMNRLKDTGYLLANSFKVIGKDSDIIKPTIHMVIFSIILTTLSFACVVLFLTKNIGTGVLLLLFLLLFALPFKFFYYIRQKADQSWIVYNTITGKDISYSDAHAHTKEQKSSLRKIAFVEMLISFAKNQKKPKLHHKLQLL